MAPTAAGAAGADTVAPETQTSLATVAPRVPASARPLSARSTLPLRLSFGLAAEAGMIDDELAAALATAAGLRNVLVHAYPDVDHERVAEAARLAPEQFAEYVRQAARWFAERPGAV